MASRSPIIDDVDEEICLCRVCLENLQDPQVLPSLNQFCIYCLKPLLENEKEASQCPECKEKYKGSRCTEAGSNDDIHMTNIRECAQIRKYLQDDTTKECCECCKQANIVAYCFICKNYLCNKCHQHHVNSNILKEHRKHTITLKEIEGVSTEKFSSISEAPKCRIHTGAVSQLCCITCKYQPICEACIYGGHVGHIYRDVMTLAQLEREKLSKELEGLDAQMGKLEAMRSSLEKLKREAISTVNEKRCEVQLRYHAEIDRVKRKIQEVRAEDVRITTKVEDLERSFFQRLEKEKEKEIQKINERYQNLARRKKEEFGNSQKHCETEITNMCQLLERQDKVLEEFLASLTNKLGHHIQAIQKIDEKCNNSLIIGKKFKRFANNRISCKEDWILLNCIPSLSETKEYFNKIVQSPELGWKPELTLETTPSFTISKETRLSFDTNRDLEVVRANSWQLSGMASVEDGNIIISGRTSKEPREANDTFISVIDVEGKTMRKDKMKSPNEICDNERFCAVLHQFKVVSVARPDEIGIYTIRDGSYLKKNIKDIVVGPPLNLETLKRRRITDQRTYLPCVTTDPENNQIFVCFSKADVHVLDEELCYLHTVELPKNISSVGGMIFTNGNLIVSDTKVEKAYVIEVTEEKSGTSLFEIQKPALDAGDWIARGSMCTDSKGLIYIMWSTVKHRIVVQYSEDGRRLLTIMRVNDFAHCMTTVTKNDSEKLVIGTDHFPYSSEEESLLIYNLENNDICSKIKTKIEYLIEAHPELNLDVDNTKKAKPALRLPTHNTSSVRNGDNAQKVNIGIINANSWQMGGMTSTEDSSIVLSGRTSKEPREANDTFISVIDVEGKTIRKNKMKGPDEIFDNERFCAVLHQFKVVSVARPDEIGIYNIRDGSYLKKNIRDVVVGPPPNLETLKRRRITDQRTYLPCVTTDPENNQIFVCFSEADVHVLDEELCYLHTVELPEKISSVGGMIFTNGNLIVSDTKEEKAYVIELTEEKSGTSLFEIQKPALDAGDWIARGSMCTDSKGLIYIMWSTVKYRIVVQYSEDGRRLLTIMRVDDFAHCMTTVTKNDTEKLVIGTDHFPYSSEEESLLIYNLKSNED